ncbi:MAG: spermidine/putrescine ABC transporter substrate-binding protein [Oscillospiraceae bacterium]|jgi:spermidine/putrescine transport system substrate-binding protein|nr:spermidine/putrescine ABC transporter substrate-binding protein [Oscillospiraceae bacterium]
MGIKRITGVFLIAAALVAAAAGCAPGNVVNVYNWGEYIDESLLEEFEKDTGIKVNYRTFETNEDMYAKLKAGGSDYDVIIPSDYMIGWLIEENMLEKLDTANIPNVSLLDPAYRKPQYDPTGEYSVGYMWGTVGIIYNTTLVDGDPTSWGALFDEKYSGNILMIDNPRDAFGIALKYLGYSLNTTNEDEIRAAYELLVKQKPMLLAYVTDTVFETMEGGNAAMAPYYAGDYMTMKEQNPDLAFCLPSEGSNVFSDGMCIPKGAANKKNAERFIDFMASTEAALRNMDVTGYVSLNREAAERRAASLSAEDAAVMFPDDSVLATCEPFLNLPQETRELYSRLWSDLRT